MSEQKRKEITPEGKLCFDRNLYEQEDGKFKAAMVIPVGENLNNVKWFIQNYPFQLENINSYLKKELQSETTRQGYLQLLPGFHQSDGFFIARLIRLE